MSTYEKGNYCIDCPENGRVGAKRNLKLSGSYCAPCRNKRQKDAYHGRTKKRSQAERVLTLVGRLRGAMAEKDAHSVYGYIDIIEARLRQMIPAEKAQDIESMTLSDHLSILYNNFEPGTHGWKAYLEQTIRPEYPDALLPGDPPPDPVTFDDDWVSQADIDRLMNDVDDEGKMDN